MRTLTKTRLLRLPQKLAFTALGVAALGTVACGGQSSNTADASVDAREDQAFADDCATPLVCIASGTVDGAVCPSNTICNPAECPDAGCIIEPIA
jgi:hypothetical protein